jgi:NAD dependent epimerase/dehydratase family enzyme
MRIAITGSTGLIGTALMSIARSFMLRRTSPITQLLAAFGLPDG